MAVLGKAEGEGEKWHGHVTAVTVDPAYRRLGIANLFMDDLEQKSDRRAAPVAHPGAEPLCAMQDGWIFRRLVRQAE